MKKLKMDKENNQDDYLDNLKRNRMKQLFRELYSDMSGYSADLLSQNINNDVVNDTIDMLMINCDIIAREYIENF